MAQFEQWEYMTRFFIANIENTGAKEYIKQKWPDWKNPPKFTPESMVPNLNVWGEAGWELVHMELVPGMENDGRVLFSSGSQFSNVYFCVFKRRTYKEA